MRLSFLLVFLAFLFYTDDVKAQCQPYIMIDGNADSPTGLQLPIWLHEGQTLSMNAAAVAVW